jgi:hypothetical protein
MSMTQERPNTEEMTYKAAVKHAVIIEDFSSIRKNTLRGFCKVVLPSGMVLHDVSIHTDAGRAWASPTSKAMISKDGAVMRDAEGKIRYAPVVSFTSKLVRDRLSNAIIDAVAATHPDALE